MRDFLIRGGEYVYLAGESICSSRIQKKVAESSTDSIQYQIEIQMKNVIPSLNGSPQLFLYLSLLETFNIVFPYFSIRKFLLVVEKHVNNDF